MVDYRFVKTVEREVDRSENHISVEKNQIPLYQAHLSALGGFGSACRI
jgi:hypothetical protein